MTLDQLAPVRSAYIGAASRELHNSCRYSACIVKPGLVVQSHRTGTGRLLATDHPQFADYAAAFDAALDSAEADALCKALLN
jgi:hypothetical protein